MTTTSSRLVVLNDFPDKNPALTPSRSHDVYVYLPADYQESTRRYPVIYLHDGNDMFLAPKPHLLDDQTMMLDVVMDHMVASGTIEPAILVGVVPSVVGRNVELPHLAREEDTFFGAGRGGGVEDYYQFLATQLKVYIDSQYRTDPSPAATGIGGASFGGLASLYMAYRHPETFGMCYCMSPSLWWDKQSLLEELEADQSPKNNVKYWFCAGTLETQLMWPPAQRAAAAFIRRGWVEGRDVAFYLDYVGGHDYGQWKASAHEMLRFMLGKEPMQLVGISIKQVQDPAGRPIKTSHVIDNPYVTVERLYAGAFRHNVAAPLVRSDDPGIVDVVPEGPLAKLESHGNGLTVLRSRLDGFSAAAIVTGYAEAPVDYPRLDCPHAPAPLDVDAPLSAWPTLPHALDVSKPKPPDTKPPTPAPPAPPAPDCQFGVWEDEKGLYVGINIVKPTLFYDPKLPPWGQDGIELRIDARPDPVRYAGIGEKEMELFLLIAMGPVPDGSLQTLHMPEKLPMGTQISCKRTDRGYTLQVMIPTYYLNASQKKPWTEFRLNVSLNAKPNQETPPWTYSLNPDWRTPENVPGSGTFARVLPDQSK